ncbi:hypothetical protein ET495_05440 [Xylanimonas allomyrinae]|uniref:Restriction endonuclease type IV Mrr domain-containing protein n=1 Tax=Xylanimonas allomyrinae TaxID=2509459 RepID=A0A4P6EM42_9MICO|nr:restriction endonuclease [Xylanimonas allomyrinae]QAY62793.1 hypothetical protein ET495_05440 [Xylanimonas allomyrinae]
MIETRDHEHVGGRPEPRRIDSWQTAEVNARDWMRWWGFADADVTGSGTDSGIDIRSAAAIAQVKREAIDVGRPVLQALVGARMAEDHLELLFFAASGYTAQAVEYADAMAIALFTYEPDGTMAPVNGAAFALVSSGRDGSALTAAKPAGADRNPFGPNTGEVIRYLADLKSLTVTQWTDVLAAALVSTAPDPDHEKAEKLLARGVDRLKYDELTFLKNWSENSRGNGLQGLVSALTAAYNASAIEGARVKEVQSTSMREGARAVDFDKSALGLDAAAGFIGGEDMRQDAVGAAVSVARSVAGALSIEAVNGVLDQFTLSSAGDVERMRASLARTIAEATGWAARALVVQDRLDDKVFDRLVEPMRSAGIAL